MLLFIYRKLFSFFGHYVGGMKGPDRHDERDFHLGVFGWGSYKRKRKRLLIPTYSTKDQIGRNTCTFESAILQKEVAEGVELSVRSLVTFAQANGYIKGDGFSSLRLSQKAIVEYGALPYGAIDESKMPWKRYSSADIWSAKMRAIAGKHKGESYWKTTNINEVYKLLDEYKPLQTAIWWYTGYNLSGGFKSPWILPYGHGYKVGAHAITVVGYDTDYCGYDVVIVKNSFGDNWGDKGLFYMRVEDFKKSLSIFGAMAQMDIPVDAGKFLKEYTGRLVKVDGNPRVYFIQNGKKRWFKDESVFLQHGFTFDEVTTVDEEALSNIPDGKIITNNSRF